MVCHWTSAVLVSRKKEPNVFSFFTSSGFLVSSFLKKGLFGDIYWQRSKYWGLLAKPLLDKMKLRLQWWHITKQGRFIFFSDCVLGGNRFYIMCLQTLVSALRHLKSKFPFHPNFEAIKVVEKKCDDRTKTSAIWIRFQKKKERYCHDLQSKLQRKGNNLLQIVQQFKIRWKSYLRTSISPATGGVKIRR